MVKILADNDGNKVAVIFDILFSGRDKKVWNEVEDYLKGYIGEIIEMCDSQDCIYIGADLPDEYKASKYSQSLKGANIKAKANAAQGLREIIRIAHNKRFKENKERKHWNDARLGWYRYDTRFAIPVLDNDGSLLYHNVYIGTLIVRHDKNGKLYLYDLINIKKETSTPHWISKGTHG